MVAGQKLECLRYNVETDQLWKRARAVDWAGLVAAPEGGSKGEAVKLLSSEAREYFEKELVMERCWSG